MKTVGGDETKPALPQDGASQGAGARIGSRLPANPGLTRESRRLIP